MDVSRETEERLTVFARLLMTWQPTVNLVRVASVEELWSRHIHDSMQLVRWMSQARTAIDLGSGAGFPGLILSIATGVRFHLVEADKRKCAFLNEAARHTEADVVVHSTRAEALNLPRMPLLTARAFQPLPKLLHLAHRFLTPDGIALLPKGLRANEEIRDAQEAGWRMRVVRHASSTGDGLILEIAGLQRG